jgi:hypothetical protein
LHLNFKIWASRFGTSRLEPKYFHLCTW